MTRRRFLASPAIVARASKQINQVSATGIEADKAFLAWGDRWNAMVRAMVHTVAAPGTTAPEAALEQAAWDDYVAARDKLDRAHEDYVKKSQ